MTENKTLSPVALRCLLHVQASRLRRIAEQANDREFQGESFAACHLAGELQQIAADLEHMVADVEALEKPPPPEGYRFPGR